MNKRRKTALLLLPFLTTYLFQATQYARAPIEYGYYVVHARNADISVRAGTDQAPNGARGACCATSPFKMVSMN